ncbi:hypothetical protein XM57_01040 [Burkholderia cepacia]|nr:hypothetical protein XM57_01040 [Burkholderia cepacia]ETP61408.1 hypothetical protein BDSB_27075 [Burkholderia dolosa PC543]
MCGEITAPQFGNNAGRIEPKNCGIFKSCSSQFYFNNIKLVLEPLNHLFLFIEERNYYGASVQVVKFAPTVKTTRFDLLEERLSILEAPYECVTVRVAKIKNSFASALLNLLKVRLIQVVLLDKLRRDDHACFTASIDRMYRTRVSRGPLSFDADLAASK